MLRVGDKVKVINRGYTYDTYVDFFKRHDIVDLSDKFINGELPNTGEVGKVLYLSGTESVIEIDGVNFIIGTEGLEKIDDFNYFNTKVKATSHSIKTNSFIGDVWHSDSSFSIGFEDANGKYYTLLDMVNTEYIDELIWCLKEIKRVANDYKEQDEI